MSLPKEYKGYGFAAAHHALAATTSIILKIFMNLTSTATTIVFWYLGGTVLVLIVSVVRSRGLNLRPVMDKMYIYLPISLVTGVGVIGWFLSVRYAGPGLASFVTQLGIVFSVLLGTLVLGERLTRLDAFGGLLALAGALAITYRSDADVLIGVLAGGVGAVGFAVQGFQVKRHARRIDKIDLLLVRSVTTLAMVLPLGLVGGGLLVPEPDLWLLAVIIATAAFVHVMVNLLLYLALDHIDLSKLGVLTVIQPVIAMTGAYLLLGDAPTTAQVAGSVLILAGITLILAQPLFAARARKAADARP